MLQRFSVMQPQVLHVANSVVPRLEDFPHFAQSRAICARENSLADPGTQGRLTTAANKMEEPASGGADRTMDHSAEFRIAAHPHMLKHPHGHEGIKAPGYIEVIVLDNF